MLCDKDMTNEVEIKTDSDGSRYWYQNGIRHRTDGPAVEYPNGSKEYWINGETVSAFEMWSLYKVKIHG